MIRLKKKKTGFREDRYRLALKEARKADADLQKVAGLLRESQRSGNEYATYALATWYLHGKYFRKNTTKALKLLHDSAERNVPDACFDLALCYEKGSGIRKSATKAFEYYLRAAIYGDKQSVFELGRCYYYGIGVKRSARLAKVWLDRAKELEVYESRRKPLRR